MIMKSKYICNNLLKLFLDSIATQQLLLPLAPSKIIFFFHADN